MMVIITRSKAIRWNYKKFIYNLFMLVGAIFVIASYFYLSNMEYQDLLLK